MSDSRPLTRAEVRLCEGLFGRAIDYDAVLLHRRKWAFFQPPQVVMAPMGAMHFHPRSRDWCDDFCDSDLHAQGLFLHEMTHIWQAQTRGRWYLPLMRLPFARYGYRLTPGKRLSAYGLEQQAEIVRHTFLLSRGHAVPGAPDLRSYRAILPFRPCCPDPDTIASA